MRIAPDNAGAHGARRSRSAEELRRSALEAAAARSPFADLPPCLGGTQSSEASPPIGGSGEFLKSELCPTCPFDASCPGASLTTQDMITDSLRSVLRPLPAWYAHRRPPRVLILSSLGQDPVFYGSTLPGLAHALRRRGVPVEAASPWFPQWNPTELPRLWEDEAYELRWEELISHVRAAGRSGGFVRRFMTAVGRAVTRPSEKPRPRVPIPPPPQPIDLADWLRQHDLGDFDLVIASDLSAAQAALATGRLDGSAQLVVADFHMLRGMDDFVARWLAPPARPHAG